MSTSPGTRIPGTHAFRTCSPSNGAVLVFCSIFRSGSSASFAIGSRIWRNRIRLRSSHTGARLRTWTLQETGWPAASSSCTRRARAYAISTAHSALVWSPDRGIRATGPTGSFIGTTQLAATTTGASLTGSSDRVPRNPVTPRPPRQEPLSDSKLNATESPKLFATEKRSKPWLSVTVSNSR
jgi:hypothetical protein